MLIDPLITQPGGLGLRGMARALERQQGLADVKCLPFEDRLGLLMQHEVAERQSCRLAQRLRWAKLGQAACSGIAYRHETESGADMAGLRTHVYFADPRSPWRWRSNENFNGLLRQYFPRSHDFSKPRPAHVKAVEDELNDRPRKRPGYCTPREVFFN